MTDRERQYIEVRAELDAKAWRDLYPRDSVFTPHQAAVGKAFTHAWRSGRLGDVPCSHEVYNVYFAAFMRYLGLPFGNA